MISANENPEPAAGAATSADPADIDRIERSFEIVLSGLSALLRTGGVTQSDIKELDRLLNLVAELGNVAIAQIEQAGGQAPKRKITRAELFAVLETTAQGLVNTTAAGKRLEHLVNVQHECIRSIHNLLLGAARARSRGAKRQEREAVQFVRNQLSDILAAEVPEPHPWIAPEAVRDMLDEIR